jgi:hypothetical protein
MDAQAQLDGFIDKFTPEVAALTRELFEKTKARIPGATILVYDNYNAMAIGFGPSEKAGQAVLSLAVMPRWVTLCFLRGVGLPDPHRLLNGSGSQVRHVRLHTPGAFDDARVQDLIEAALQRSDPPIDEAGEQKLIIKSVSAKQRPRRPAQKWQAWVESGLYGFGTGGSDK